MRLKVSTESMCRIQIYCILDNVLLFTYYFSCYDLLMPFGIYLFAPSIANFFLKVVVWCISR